MASKPQHQAHQNRTAYKPNRGKTVKDREKEALQAAFSASMAGVCERCAEQIKWKHKYGKFKPLTQPRKCNGCEKKTVRATYHNLCRECASSKKVCCKCQSSPAATSTKPEKTAAEEAEELADKLAGLRERERRAAQRAIARGETPAILGGEGGARRRQQGGGGDDDSDFDSDDDFDDEDEDGEAAGGGRANGAAAGAGPRASGGGAQRAAAGKAGGGDAGNGGSDSEGGEEDEEEGD